MKKTYIKIDILESRPGKKLTNEDFLQRIKATNLTALEPYINALTSIRFRCFCGNEFNDRPSRIFGGERKSCGCNETHGLWKGTGDMSGAYLLNVKNNAITRGLSFDITPEYMWNLFIKQNRKCIYSGRILYFVKSYWSDKTSQTASLDRLNPLSGYVEGNVQWIHKDINQMKWNMSEWEFISLCKEITENLNQVTT